MLKKILQLFCNSRLTLQLNCNIIFLQSGIATFLQHPVVWFAVRRPLQQKIKSERNINAYYN